MAKICHAERFSLAWDVGAGDGIHNARESLVAMS